jgi:hypothetical protein
VRPAIGCNLDGNSDWNTGHIWADAAHAFRAWGKPTNPGEPDPALPLAPDGTPLVDAACVSYLANYPNGTYKLTWSGAGEVLAGGMCQTVNVQHDGKGHHTADVVLKHDNPDGYTGGNIVIVIRNQQAHDPARDIHLWSPGYGPGEAHAGQTFHEDYLRRVRPFGSVRFMDWAMTNNSAVVQWKDRTPKEAMIQLTNGIAWEYIVEMANTVHRDAWINVPDMASDDYVRQLATFMRDHLEKGLKLRVEYSNEVWNAGFKQFGRTFERSKRDDRVTAKDDYSRIAQEYGLRAADCLKIFRDVYGDRAAEVIGVIGGQTSNTYFADTALAAIKQSFGDPKVYFQEMAIAPYVGNDLPKEAPAGGWSPDTLFPEMDRFIDTTLTTWIADTKKTADRYGLIMVAYESGQHLTGNTTLAEPLKIQANHDPRMYGMYRHLMRVWREQGGGLFNAFSHIGGGWGLLDSVRDGGSYKWDATMADMLPAGDATLDGRVTWEDFQVLKRNFGKKPAWWEQGDFNGDNVVDGKDLELMLTNLKDLTPAQREEVNSLRK